MTFQSLTFWAFLAAAVTGYRLVPQRLKRHVLLAVSYAFYLTWSLPGAVLLLALTFEAYYVARTIERAGQERARRWLMAFATTSMLAVMAFFKYAGTGIVAPLGLSYYVFKLVGYVVDVYWENVPAQQSALAVANYAAFFPPMISGPIQRAGDFFLQTERLQTPGDARVRSALRLILFGFFEKLVVADRIGLVIDPWMRQLHAQPAAHLLWLLYLFPIQLYADFSGITDIAIGVGRLFGIELPPNFDAPFYAPNISEFWRRWHMSLSSWLRDYLFTPLNYAMRGAGLAGLVFSLMVTMMAIGVWHGARSSFWAFGAINGVYMAVSALTLRRRNRWFKRHPRLAAARDWFSPLILFHLIVVAFIFFRATTASDAVFILLHGVRGFADPMSLVAVPSADRVRFVIVAAGVAAMELGHLAQRRRDLLAWFDGRAVWVRWSTYYATGLAIVLLGVFTTRTFIYQQF